MSCAILHPRAFTLGVVCGYSVDVEWDESAALDVMLLPALADATGRPRTQVATALKRLQRRSGDLLGTLGFFIEPERMLSDGRCP
jgi:hypothetical protein